METENEENQTMKLGILCATAHELKPLAERLENHQTERVLMREFHTGKLCGLDTVVVMGGVGKVNAAMTVQLMIEKMGITTLFFTGVAGGLDDRIQIGDVIIGTELLNHDIDMNLLNNENMFPGMPENGFSSDEKLVELCRGLGENLWFGRIITGDSFITGSQRDALIERFHPLCVDMESAAAAQVCWFYQVPILVIRSLSDHADAEETYEQNVEQSSVSATGVMMKIVRELASRG